MSVGAELDLGDVTSSEGALRRFLVGLPGVDAVGAEARVAALATRSLKAGTKRRALDLAIAMVDLTTLEGADTPGKVRAMCAKALRPDPNDGSAPSVAAVCVYPDLVAVAVEALGHGATGRGGGSGPGSKPGSEPGSGPGSEPGSGRSVKVASVATAFPSGRASRAVKLADVCHAVAAGADEVDMVIDRGEFLAGHYGAVLDDIRATKEVCGGTHLKVILETGELATYDNVRRASWLAMLAGADFIKTSTGKVAPAATLPVALVMLEAVRDFASATGRHVGVKVAGGVRAAKDALRYMVVVHETAGDAWLAPDRFRIGASSLLNDLLMQRTKQRTGAYSGPDYFTLD